MKILLLTCFSLLLISMMQAQTGVISGAVQDAEERIPLEAVTVSLLHAGTATLTDPSGRFSIPFTSSGEDTLIVFRIGFESARYPVTLSVNEAISMDVSITKKSIRLEEIQVSSQPEWTSNVISSIDIELRNNRTSQDILRMVPGLFIAQHAGGGKAEQIFLRGFDIDHGTDIAITTDGMPVNMVSHAHGQGYADLHFLIPETVDRVHFGKGPYHTHHGNLATAGYVGFNTMNQLDESRLMVEGGSNDTYRGLAMVRLLHQQKASRQQHLYVAGEYFGSKGYFDSPQDFRRENIFAKYNSTIGRKGYLNLAASHFYSRWDASGQIPLRAVESGQIGFFGAIDDTEGGITGRSNLNAQYHTQLGARDRMRHQVYYTHYDFELYSNFTFFLQDPIHGDQIRQKEDRNLFGYKGLYSRQGHLFGKASEMEFGVQWRHDLSMDNELSRTTNRTDLRERLAFGDVTESNAGVYLNEAVHVTDHLVINSGLRFDYFSFGYVDHLDADITRKANDQIVSPKLNVNWTISPSLLLTGNAGYGFHSNDTRVVVLQNAEETLPRATGVDVGFLWKPVPSIFLGATMWSLELEQEFVYVGDEAIVEPSGRTMRKGIEVSARYQVLPWLYADVDCNITRARATEEPEGADYIPLAPVFSSIGGLTMQLDNGWNASVRYRHLGDRAANEDNSVIARGYTVTDALVSYRWKRYQAALHVDNVFDVRWREAQFETESRLRDEAASVSEIHFTPGIPRQIRAQLSYLF